MIKIPMRKALPYGSIQLRVPAEWFEDSTAKDFCIYYRPEKGGPPVLHVRRDDFNYKPQSQVMSIQEMALRRAHGDKDNADELFNAFKQLVERLEAPDIIDSTVEPRSPHHGQLIRYKRIGVLHKKPGIANWWVKALKTGDLFTVASFGLEMYAQDAETDFGRSLIAAMDGEICSAKIMSLDDAEIEAAKREAREAAEKAEG